MPVTLFPDRLYALISYEAIDTGDLVVTQVRVELGRQRESAFSGLEWWIGMLDWSTGIEYWSTGMKP